MREGRSASSASQIDRHAGVRGVGGKNARKTPALLLARCTRSERRAGGKAKAGTGGPSFEGALGRSGGRGRARGRAFNAGRGGGDRGQSALSSGGPCGVRQGGKREHPGVEFALVRLSSPLSSLSLFLLSLSHPLSRLVDMSLVNDKQRTKEAEKGEFSHSSPTHSHDGAMAPAPSKKGGFQGATMPEGTTCVVCSSKESSSLSPVAWC